MSAAFAALLAGCGAPIFPPARPSWMPKSGEAVFELKPGWLWTYCVEASRGSVRVVMGGSDPSGSATIIVRLSHCEAHPRFPLEDPEAGLTVYTSSDWLALTARAPDPFSPSGRPPSDAVAVCRPLLEKRPGLDAVIADAELTGELAPAHATALHKARIRLDSAGPDSFHFWSYNNGAYVECNDRPPEVSLTNTPP